MQTVRRGRERKQPTLRIRLSIAPCRCGFFHVDLYIVIVLTPFLELYCQPDVFFRSINDALAFEVQITNNIWTVSGFRRAPVVVLSVFDDFWKNKYCCGFLEINSFAVGCFSGRVGTAISLELMKFFPKSEVFYSLAKKNLKNA